MQFSRSQTVAPAFIALLIIGSSIGLLIGKTSFVAAQDEDAAESVAAFPSATKTLPEKQGQPVAVVELFTSEGCSSCPPADKNLQRISKLEAAAKGSVIPLSFHVDYWNSLGWKDPFSQPGFSERQREYAHVMNQKNVYTPQMIVNGEYAFNGADETLTDKAISIALRRPVSHLIELTVSSADPGDRTTIHYQVDRAGGKTGDESDYVLNLAVVTDAESVTVTRGENGGRELSHVWVVKSLDMRPLFPQQGAFNIDTAQIIKDRTRVIAYIQSKATGRIGGASAVQL